MAENLTLEQVLDEHIAAMGPHLGSVYNALWNDCIWLHAKWQEYCELYGAGPDRIDLLNSAASFFFRIVQDALWEDTLLHLARLTDPPRSVGKQNLTLRQLPDLVVPELRPEVNRLVADARDKAEFARDWRNRHIAHRDLAKALGQAAEPLASASRNHVADALAAIAEIINCLSLFYFKSTIVFDVIRPLTGSVSLLYVVRDGLEERQKRLDRLRAGRALPEDLEPRRAV